MKPPHEQGSSDSPYSTNTAYVNLGRRRHSDIIHLERRIYELTVELKRITNERDAYAIKLDTINRESNIRSKPHTVR